MKEEYAKAWMAALRSGKYKQLKGRLTDGKRHCCLGVLCEVCELKPRENVYDGSHLTLPASVISLAGIRDEYGYIAGSTTLSCLNDIGYSFDEIADVIEDNWEIL